MSYRIDYAPQAIRKGSAETDSIRPFTLTLCFFALFCLLVRAFWPEGTMILRQLLLGEQGESMLECLEEMVHSLQDGQTLHDAAVGAFRDVIHGH